MVFCGISWKMCGVLWYQSEDVWCLVVSVGRCVVFSGISWKIRTSSCLQLSILSFFLLFVLNSVVVERSVAQHSSLAEDSLLLKFIISKVYNTCVYTHQTNKLGHIIIIMLHLRTN